MSSNGTNESSAGTLFEEIPFDCGLTSVSIMMTDEAQTITSSLLKSMKSLGRFPAIALASIASTLVPIAFYSYSHFMACSLFVNTIIPFLFLLGIWSLLSPCMIPIYLNLRILEQYTPNRAHRSIYGQVYEARQPVLPFGFLCSCFLPYLMVNLHLKKRNTYQ